MSINSVGSLNFGCVYGISYGLSEETKRKLIELGIDPASVHSESEARIRIENVLKMRKLAIPQEENFKSILTHENNEKNNTAILDLLNYDANIKKILFKIEDNI